MSKGLRSVGEAHLAKQFAAAAKEPQRKHKYGAEPVVVDGHWFASKREAKRWQELEWMRALGEVLLIVRQVGFEISPAVRDETGHVKAPAQRYIADFLVHWKDGRVTVEDAKGMKTATYLNKKRRVEAIYKITIVEV